MLMEAKRSAKAGLSKIPSCILCKTVTMTTINQGISFWLSILPFKLTVMTNAHLPLLVSVFTHQCSFETLAKNLREVPKSGVFVRHEPSELSLKACWKSLLYWASTVTSWLLLL